MKKFNFELDKEELTMISAILLMHSTGFILPIHKDRLPMVHKLAEKFALENIRSFVEK